MDDLLRTLLPVQPLAAMAQNLHWHYILPQMAGECAPILLDANTLAKGCALQPDAVYCLPLPRAAGVEDVYKRQAFRCCATARKNVSGWALSGAVFLLESTFIQPDKAYPHRSNEQYTTHKLPDPAPAACGKGVQSGCF